MFDDTVTAWTIERQTRHADMNLWSVHVMMSAMCVYRGCNKGNSYSRIYSIF